MTKHCYYAPDAEWQEAENALGFLAESGEMNSGALDGLGYEDLGDIWSN